MKNLRFCLILLCVMQFSCIFDIDHSRIISQKIFVELDKSVYYKDELGELTIKNYSDEELILGHCAMNPGFTLEKKIDGEWIVPYNLMCAAIGQPFHIKIGEVFKDTFHFPLIANSLHKVEGTYRLKLHLRRASEETPGKYIEDHLRTTKPFKILDN